MYSSPGGRLGPAASASPPSVVTWMRSPRTGMRSSSPTESTLGSAIPLSRCSSSVVTPADSAISASVSPGCTM